MFSPNQLYDYLRYYCITNKKSVTVRNFITNGSKNLNDLVPTHTPYTSDQPDMHNTPLLRRSTGFIEMYDQEPVDIDAFYSATICDLSSSTLISNNINYISDDFVFSNSASLYSPIICHSESNSADIKKFRDNFHIPVHFWSNALTSIFWFNCYRLLDYSKHSIGNTKRFGMYIRDTSGTRKYRKDLLAFARNNTNNQIFCPALLNHNKIIPSDASASIDWQDRARFDIQLVPETLFNTDKTHLTEKIFKPIVMYQPFILFAGPHSLEYIKSYGFKTFGDIWDEGYDVETDSELRYKKILSIITRISEMSKKDYNSMLKKTKDIVLYNRAHFYSSAFCDKLMNELLTGMNTAIQIQEESFYTVPGGSLFYYYDMYRNAIEPTVFNKSIVPILADAYQTANKKSRSVGDAIVKKYRHLL
jgi:hypothetical protein